FRMLSDNALDWLERPNGDAGGQIRRHRHAGSDLHIQQSRIDKPLPHAFIVRHPGQLEAVSALGARRERKASARLTPSSSDGLDLLARSAGMNKHAVGGWP